MIEFHRLLMGDRVRNDAFAKALKAAVKPGSVIADIGSGTGFLGFLASKLGAKECHLIEMDHETAKLSKVIAKKNGMTNCNVIAGHSTDVPKPVKADVVVSETLGNYALEEGIVETMNDAVKRFLKPGGTVIPRALRQYVAPVASDRLWTELNVWPSVGFDLDFSDAESKTINNVYVREIKPSELLSGGVREWDSIDFLKQNKSVRGGTVTWQIASAVTVSGFCVFWEADLGPGIALSTAPDQPMTHWQQIYMPVAKPIGLQAGETLGLTITSDTRPAIKVNLAWEITVTDQSKKQKQKQILDMKRG